MAQLVARLHGMEEVAGSNPAKSTKFFANRGDFGSPPELYQASRVRHAGERSPR